MSRVDVDGWDWVMIRHRLWAKLYWHIWEHMEHQHDMDYRHAAMWIGSAMAVPEEDAA